MGYSDSNTIGQNGAKARKINEHGAVDSLFNSVLDVIFPQPCIGCKKLGKAICEICRDKIANTEMDFPICFVCENLSIDGKTHLACKHKTPISQYFASHTYSGIPKKILQAKSERPALLNVLLATAIQSKIKADLIIPIPPTIKYFNPRLVEPTDIIANHISAVIQAPIYKALYKPAMAKQQKKLNLIKRLSPKIYLKREAIPMIRNKRILLIDDVCTTGSTMNEAARLLRQFHCLDVSAYTLARDLRYIRA